MIEVEEARIKIKGESSPFRPLPPTKLNDIFVHVEDLNEEIHTNQTGAFPHTSQCGNRYIVVAVHLDANFIFTKPMKNRMEGEMIRVSKDSQQDESGRVGTKKTGTHKECSAAMKACIKEKGMDYKLIPPGQHRRNQAERAIQTFKAHFISILASVNNKLPLLLWCHLLKPAELTLNLLRQSRVATKISASCASMAPMTTCKNHLRQSNVRSKCTSSPTTVCHRTQDQNQVSTWTHPWNTTNISGYV